MTKHTPGPWHTAGDQGVQIRSAKDQIAKVWCMRGNEFKANAQLIAAAPDLLEALQTVLGTWNEEFGYVLNRDPEWVINARAAIAKATGEQQ